MNMRRENDKDLVFMVTVTVPGHMSAFAAQQALQTSIAFGRPEIVLLSEVPAGRPEVIIKDAGGRL